MKIRITLLLIVLAFVLLSTGAGALSAPRYQVEPGTVVGGGYRLTSVGLQTGSVAVGGAYRLVGPSAPVQQNSGCCCTNLPCVLRNK